MVTQRSIAQAFLALQAGLTAIAAVLLFLRHNAHAAGAAAAALAYTGCWVAFRRGLEWAREVAVVTLTLVLVVFVREPYLTEQPVLAVMVPPIVALMLTSPAWVIGSAAGGLLGVAVRSGFKTPLLNTLELLVFGMSIAGLVLVRRSVDAAMARLREQAEHAEVARTAAEVARKAAELAAQEAIAERDRATKLEATLLQMQRLESVGRLAGGVAHDFNNLLTVIGASASMAERAAQSGESPQEDLHEVHRAVNRAAELTKQLLAFARKQVLVKRPCDVNALISGVERMIGRLVARDAVIHTELCSSTLRVQADPGQLEQVVVNLIINARDALTDGGRILVRTCRTSLQPLPGLELEGLSAGDYACIEVSDDGCGMTPEVQRRLFEPFFTTKPTGHGTGLGLATSFGIVRQHEGTIQVESALGKGTSMRVLLPLTLAADVPATSGVVRVVSQRPRVLVVEDEPQVRALTVRTLLSAGFEVQQAPDGAAALSLAAAQLPPFDVVVTDIVMPELSGPELARSLKKLQAPPRLVFMSGFPDSMQDAYPGEFSGVIFLAKPFSPQELIVAVRDCVESEQAEAGGEA